MRDCSYEERLYLLQSCDYHTVATLYRTVPRVASMVKQFLQPLCLTYQIKSLLGCSMPCVSTAQILWECGFLDYVYTEYSHIHNGGWDVLLIGQELLLSFVTF